MIDTTKDSGRAVSAVGPVQPPLRLRRFGAVRVVLHPFRAASALAQLAGAGHEADLKYRTALKLCVALHLELDRR